jgi:hypothetical protein
VHVARRLACKLSDREVDVLFDHGDPAVDRPDCLGKIASWFGSHLSLATRLALLDIDVVQRDTNAAAALIEIEETTATPKVLLGDLLGTLLGDHVTFHSTHHLEVGPGTTLIVLVRARSEPKRRQTAELAGRVRDLQPHLRSGNAAIGRVVVRPYAGADELAELVERLVREALDRVDDPADRASLS